MPAVAEVSTSVPPDLVGTTLSDRFRLDARLGAGGFGVVYRAWDNTRGHAVAIKVLREELYARSSLRRRFEREAEALISLNHPNIVAISDVGVAGAMPYIAMELLEGRDLGQVLKAEGPLGEDRATEITDELLAGIGHMHAQGLVHRDLKPANVFLEALPGGAERVKLLDFGLAKFLNVEDGGELPSLTKTGEVFGTPGYMPPEQLVSEQLDHRADLYSVVVIVFQMLSGRRPFEGEAHEVLRKVLVEPPPSLASVRKDVGVRPELDAWLQTGMSKDRGARADSAEGLRASFSALPRPLLKGTKRGRRSARPKAPDAPRAQADAPQAQAVAKPPEPGPARRRRPGLGARLSALLRRVLVASATLVSFISVLAIGAGLLAIFVLKWGEPRPPSAAGAPAEVTLAGGSAAMPSAERPEPSQLASPQPPEAPRLAGPQAPNTPTTASTPDPGAVALPPPDDAGRADAGPVSDAGTEPGTATLDKADAAEPSPDAGAEPGTTARATPDAPAPTSPPAVSAWPARDPFRRPLPRSLARLRREIDRGSKGNERTLSTLRNYNRNHPDDARGNLLLAQLYLNRRWHRDAVRQYAFAVGRDPGARGDRRMLKNLIVLVETSKLADDAATLIARVYGPEAANAVAKAERAAKKTGRDRAAERLAVLRETLARDTTVAD